MARKLTGESESMKNNILGKLDEDKSQNQLEVEGRVLVDVAVDDYGNGGNHLYYPDINFALEENLLVWFLSKKENLCR